jgi:nicotinate-nucleotide adenylyltransferase
MDGARHGPDTPLIQTAILGGSFNPAHRGHRRISLFAAHALGVEEVWWLVSPGNPLKEGAKDMAPLCARLKSANAMARRSIIRPTAIEQFLGTRYTVDTLAELVRRYPNRRFIWLMGADNLAQFPQWRDWRKIAQMLPIAVIARPGYSDRTRAARAMGWLRRFVRPARQAKYWAKWRLPALVLLRLPPDKSSATAVRRSKPEWYRSLTSNPVRDPLTRLMID